MMKGNASQKFSVCRILGIIRFISVSLSLSLSLLLVCVAAVTMTETPRDPKVTTETYGKRMLLSFVLHPPTVTTPMNKLEVPNN